MKNFYKGIVSLCFMGFLVFPSVIYSASQDNNTGPQEKIKVTDERHKVEGSFFYLNIPEGGLLLTGSFIEGERSNPKSGQSPLSLHGYLYYKDK